MKTPIKKREMSLCFGRYSCFSCYLNFYILKDLLHCKKIYSIIPSFVNFAIPHLFPFEDVDYREPRCRVKEALIWSLKTLILFFVDMV